MQILRPSRKSRKRTAARTMAEQWRHTQTGNRTIAADNKTPFQARICCSRRCFSLFFLCSGGGGRTMAFRSSYFQIFSNIFRPCKFANLQICTFAAVGAVAIRGPTEQCAVRCVGVGLFWPRCAASRFLFGEPPPPEIRLGSNLAGCLR